MARSDGISDAGDPPGGMDQRFPKECRVLKRGDFTRAVQQGRRRRNPLFSIAVYDRHDALPARLGLSAPKRLGKAAVRNRAKRRTREFFRKTRGRIRAGVDIVALFHPPCADASYAELSAAFEALLEQACALNPPNQTPSVNRDFPGRGPGED
ncbi:ribonuclease P protein component [Candidatus Sumerlaeota bacterium]|nr:ribonuclease P protein component [Candidatus Sumerlaeota bacterium]